MKIKKYVAKTMPDAMNEIKKDLGADAVILNSKEIKTGGFLGFFQKKSIEVIAALDQELAPKQLKQEIQKRPTTMQAEYRNNTIQVNNEVLDELKHVKQLLATQSFQSDNGFPPMFENVYQYLLTQEVDEAIAKEITAHMLEKAIDENNIAKTQLKQIMKAEIERRLEHLAFEGLTNQQQIIQFVGPTGVGKTTTLAKIAALSMLDEKKEIAFITTDTYRIAAIEQLKTYARILNVPVEVAYSLEDYQNALQKFADYDYIFVDTAGRNYRDERYINELKNIIDFEKYKVETYLVLSLTAKPQDIVDIYNQFAAFPIEKVIFTKLDETLTYGSMLNISTKENIDIAYITNGQDVPDDVLKPNKQMISELIVSRYADA